MLYFACFRFLRCVFHLMPLKSLNLAFFPLPNIYLSIPCLNTPSGCGKCLRKRRKSGKRKKAGRKKRKSGKRKKRRSGELNAAKAENKALFPFSLRMIKQF